MTLYGGARGGGKSPVTMLIRIHESMYVWEHIRKGYGKARWKKANSRRLVRAAKSLGIPLKK